MENGYGAVTIFNYTKLNNKWMHVTTVDTWDGVAAKYTSTSRPQTRLSYDRTGATTCFDSDGSPCHLAFMPPSDSLVGFNGVTILTQDGGWTTLVKQVLTFKNDNYWLLGKELTRSTQTPAGVELSSDSYTWTEVGGDDRLQSEVHAMGDRVGVFLGRETKYYYDDAAYGALIKKEEKDEAGNPFRCTTYAYAHLTTGANWLVNRPIRETLFAGPCSGAGSVKTAETLYRYKDSTKPTVTGLDTRALLSYAMRWTTGTKYVLEKRTYEANGAPQAIITYSGLIGSGANNYTLDEHNRTTYYYTNNTLGRATQIMHSGVDAKTENQWLTYNASFYWLVSSVSDSNQTVTQYGYDTFGRLERVALPGDSLDPDNQTITYAYADGLAPWKVETSYKNSIRSAERVYYDGLGRTVQTQTDNVSFYNVTGDKDLVTSVAYDARGLEVCRTVPFSVGAGANIFDSTACSNKAKTTTAYDTLGRPVSVMTPDEVVSSVTYGVATDVTVTGHSTFLRTSTIDGNGHKVERYNDVFGRLVLVREFTGASTYTAYADTRYSYDVLGNLTAVGTSVAGNPPVTFLRLTQIEYDRLGRKTKMIDQDMGTWFYAYDPAGNLIRQQDPDNVLCFRYDGLSRLRQRYLDDEPAAECDTDGPSGSDAILASYVYGTSAGNHNIGRPVEINWGPSPTQNKDTFTYDAEGRPKKQTRLVNGQEFAYEVVTYDLLDRPTQVKLYTGPAAKTINYSYDEERENTLSAGSTQLISDVGYNERGQLAFMGRTGTATNVTLSYHDATKNFRLSKIQYGPDGGALPDFLYSSGSYDAVGNVTGMQMKLNGSIDSYSFSYDEQNRLTVTTLDGMDAAANFIYTYAYDRLGNITNRTGTDPDMTYSYGAGVAGPQAVTEVDQTNGYDDLTFTYDTRGNMATKAKSGTVSHIYTFDAENRLASVKTGNQTMSFAYDADGQRVLTTRHDGTKIYTPFSDYEVEIPTSGSTVTRTTYRLAGQMIAIQHKIGAASTFYYTYTDHLGNVAALSWTGGTIVPNSLSRFDPFGNYRTRPDWSANPTLTDHGFTGHRHNNTGVYPTKNVGLIYMNARYYLPEVGRFISPDTIVPEPGNPQSFNRYAYVRNSPMNFTDPSGHCIVAYSGDVRMGEGPYGTSGLCANTDHWITEGNASIEQYHRDLQKNAQRADGFSIYAR